MYGASQTEPYVVPVPGFNPLTASVAEDNAQGFPPPPAGAAADVTPTTGGLTELAIWQRYVQWYLHGVVINCASPPAPGQPLPPGANPTLVAEAQVIDSHDFGANSAKTGWVVDGNQYTDSETNSIVPTVTGSGSDQVGNWVGINFRREL